MNDGVVVMFDVSISSLKIKQKRFKMIIFSNG